MCAENSFPHERKGQTGITIFSMMLAHPAARGVLIQSSATELNEMKTYSNQHLTKRKMPGIENDKNAAVKSLRLLCGA